MRCLFCVSLTTSCSAGIIGLRGLRGLNRERYTLPNIHHVRLEICEVGKLIVSPLVPLTHMKISDEFKCLHVKQKVS